MLFQAGFVWVSGLASPFANILYRPAESGGGRSDGTYQHGTPAVYHYFAFIGVATRHWLRKVAIPYTISLLIIGFLLGIAYRVGLFSSFWGLTEESGLAFGRSINWAGHIDPHVILFIFLPTLIFEAAFAMHVHTFKKSFTNAFILAFPGIFVALVLTGAACMLIKVTNIGLSQWDWKIALLFGVIISATDPVAVVQSLRRWEPVRSCLRSLMASRC